MHKSMGTDGKILADYYRKNLKFTHETGNIEIAKYTGCVQARLQRGDYVEARQTDTQKF